MNGRISAMPTRLGHPPPATMKAAEAIQKTGALLQENYKSRGFKYNRSDKCLVRTSGDFSYLVILYSGRGNKEGKDIKLYVDMAINCDKKFAEMDLDVGQLFYVNLMLQEHTVYNIATDELIAQSVKDISAKMDAILIPFMEKLEGDPARHEQEWIQHGFFSDKIGFKGHDLGFVINFKFIAALFGKDKAEECLKYYLSTLSAEDRTAFVDGLTGKGEFTKFKPSIYGKYAVAKELGLNPH